MDKTSFDVTFVRHLFCLCTVTFIKYNSIKPVLGNIYQMISKNTQLYYLKSEDLLQNVQSMPKNYVNFTAKSVIIQFARCVNSTKKLAY